jgi:hypothetical protein
MVMAMRRARGVRRIRLAFVVAAALGVVAACTDQSESASSSGLTSPRTSTVQTTSTSPAKSVTNTLPPPARGSTWKPVFDDEFGGSALDPAHWATCYYWSSTTCTNASTHELELYTPKNVNVAAGELQLTAKREAASAEGRRFAYTSGMVSSASPARTMFAFRYGYI